MTKLRKNKALRYKNQKKKNDKEAKFSQNKPRKQVASKVMLLKLLATFEQSNEATYAFPASLTPEQRAFLHNECKKRGLLSRSKGKQKNRRLTVKKSSPKLGNIKYLGVPKKAFQLIKDYFHKHPIQHAEQRWLSLKGQETGFEQGFSKQSPTKIPSELAGSNLKLMTSLAKTVPDDELTRTNERFLAHFSSLSVDPELTLTRQSLPVHEKRSELIQAVRGDSHPDSGNVSITIITGETGCGKSTQIPQFLLEDFAERLLDPEQQTGQCKIIVTQPRRISAVSLAERVSNELGEPRAGGLVGYSVRLDSVQSERTRILYCTTGTLLRSLSVNQQTNMLSGTTHLVLDEVHERDSNCDFLLAIVRGLVSARKALVTLSTDRQQVQQPFHVILMSATLQANKFSSYFAEKGITCQHVHVPGSLHPITVHYLDSILSKTGFLSKVKQSDRTTDALMSQYEETLLLNEDPSSDVEQVFSKADPVLEAKALEESKENQFACKGCSAVFATQPDYFLHSAMCTSAVEENEEDESSEFIEYVGPVVANTSSRHDISLYQYSRMLRRLNNEKVPDLMLILAILELIHHKDDDLSEIIKGGQTLRFSSDPSQAEDGPSVCPQQSKGAVLIFLSGWSDISALIELLESHRTFGQKEKFVIYPLHSGIDLSSQRDVFKPTGAGIRKIVVSTNIAETSVTIADVLYVIDGVTSKQLAHDPSTSISTLAVNFCDRASCTQRAGRAGRVKSGVCFRLISSNDFQKLDAEGTPELLRMSLEEITLQVASMYRSSKEKAGYILGFLQDCPDSPPLETVQNAIALLQRISALDRDEQLTSLGEQLALLPLHPCAGKMLLLSACIGTACFQESLSLCAFEGVARDAFFMTPDLAIRERQDIARKKLSMGYQSDHLVLLNLLHKWLASTKKYQFCRQHGVSFSFLQNVSKVRRQLLTEYKRLRRSGAALELAQNHQQQTLFSSGELEFMVAMCNSERFAVKFNRKGTFQNPQEKKMHVLKSSSVTGAPIYAIHDIGSSSNSAKHSGCQFVSFSEIRRTERACLLKNCSRLSFLSTVLFSKDVYLQTGRSAQSLLQADAETDDEIEVSSISSMSSQSSASSSSSDSEKIVLGAIPKEEEGFDEVDFLANTFMKKYTLESVKKGKVKHARKNQKRSAPEQHQQAITFLLNDFLEVQCKLEIARYLALLRRRIDLLLSRTNSNLSLQKDTVVLLRELIRRNSVAWFDFSNEDLDHQAVINKKQNELAELKKQRKAEQKKKRRMVQKQKEAAVNQPGPTEAPPPASLPAKKKRGRKQKISKQKQSKNLSEKHKRKQDS